jgi:hypothetical protein
LLRVDARSFMRPTILFLATLPCLLTTPTARADALGCSTVAPASADAAQRLTTKARRESLAGTIVAPSSVLIAGTSALLVFDSFRRAPLLSQTDDATRVAADLELSVAASFAVLSLAALVEGIELLKIGHCDRKRAALFVTATGPRFSLRF